MSINKTNKVAIISAKAERIGESDKIKCVIKTAALDIENNFLDMEMMGIFVDGKQVTQEVSDTQGELAITLQLDYNPEQEGLAVHVQHLATGVNSPRKYIPIVVGGQKEHSSVTESNTLPTKTLLDKSSVIATMKDDGIKLGDPEYMQYNDDYTIVLAAVKQNGAALQFASDRLKNDSSIVDEALCQDADYIHFASEEQQRTYAMQVREVIDKLERENSIINNIGFETFMINFDKGKTVIQNTSSKLLSNGDIILKALAILGYSIYHTIPENTRKAILNKREFALKATLVNKITYRFLSKNLQNDPDIKKAAGK